MTPPTRPFLDTNVLLYLLSADWQKADRAEALLVQRATINVQVLNEFTSVARRKLEMPWREIDDVLSLVRTQCDVRDVSVAVHDHALTLAQRYRLGWYDALLVAAAVDAGCDLFYSEDIHHGLVVEGRLTLCDPFRS
jgi:predicted nucleic acid-binding protein